MYNNPYMPSAYNQQSSIDRINEQINQLENIRRQMLNETLQRSMM